MHDTDDELREIKREIVESRGLVIKTNNLTNALSADLKSISKRQQAFEKRAFRNSAVAYVVFVVVVLGLVKIAWDARADSVTAKDKGAIEKAAGLQKELDELKAQLAARASGETAAASFYELVRAGRRRELVEQFDTLRKLPLSRAELAFLGDAVDAAREGLSVELYHQGLDHIRGGRFQEAATTLEDSLKMSDKAAHTPGAKLELARAYRKLGRQRLAVPILVPLSESSPNREILDDASMLLAECLVDVQAYNDAKGALRSFLRRFPESPYANDARMMLADLNLKH
jgi:TolA-binding protein